MEINKNLCEFVQQNFINSIYHLTVKRLIPTKSTSLT